MWKIIRRKFTALTFPRGSPQRNQFNRSAVTSEYARNKPWLVVNEDNKPLKAFKNVNECNDFIKNPSAYKSGKVYKYTPDDQKRAMFWNSVKRTNIKRSLGIF